MTTNAPTPPPPVHTNPNSFETAYLFTGLVWTQGLKHLCRAISKSSLNVIFRVITLTNKRTTLLMCQYSSWLRVAYLAYRGRISSVGGALDCRAGGRGFDSRGRTNSQGLKITEK